ncbi:orotate phosphoribosyltransferase [Candidatus Peregrinibacteria bacterium]|nr:orotate phosphoribosyltransferase [Candidatus Peregrinibacteria bacterium]
MEQYKQEFVEFLIRVNALQFGSFTLKSGRQAPYFFNAGSFYTGDMLFALARFYAQALIKSGFEHDVIYGPAYKGIPLAVSLAMALFRDFQISVSYAFNRKEAKQYGQKDTIIGAPLLENTRVVLVDDVITAGTAVRESVDFLKNNGNPRLVGILIALDRMEKNNDGNNALQELEKTLAIPVISIINMKEVLEYLDHREIDGRLILDDQKMAQIQEYRSQYGIS